MFNFLRCQKRGRRDKGLEKVLFGKTTPIKVIHFPNNLGNLSFLKKLDFYLKEVKLPVDGGTLSSAFYDRPWYFSSPREMNFFIRLDFN